VVSGHGVDGQVQGVASDERGERCHARRTCEGQARAGEDGHEHPFPAVGVHGCWGSLSGGSQQISTVAPKD
jgi:hypothetical protein